MSFHSYRYAHGQRLYQMGRSYFGKKHPMLALLACYTRPISQKVPFWLQLPTGNVIQKWNDTKTLLYFLAD